jgi:hypothetical protein
MKIELTQIQKIFNLSRVAFSSPQVIKFDSRILSEPMGVPSGFGGIHKSRVAESLTDP